MLWRVHVELEDRPGRLGELATAVGGAGGDILALHVVGEPGDDGSVTDELLLRVPEGREPSALVAAIEAAGIPCTLLARADAAELSDPATTALALARMVVADPGTAPRAVATLLRARVVDPAAGPSHALRVGARHVHLGRAWPFTATELSRAAALLELAGQAALGGRGPAAADPVLLLRDGSEVRVRPAARAHAPLVVALHARCSPQTRRAAYLGPGPRPAPGALGRLLGELGPAVLALTTDGGSAVGVGALEDAGAGAVRATVLVEDAWQGRGLGAALLRRIAELAVERGFAELAARVRPEDVRVTRLWRRAGLRPCAELVDDALHVHAPLPAPAAVAG